MGKSYKKVLIVRTGAIGDVVHTTNLVHSLKEAYPDIKIHYMTNGSLNFIFASDSSVEKIIPIDPKFKLFSNDFKTLVKELKEEKYDIAINLQPSFKIKLLLFLSGISKQLIYRKNFKIHAVTNFWQTGLKAFPLMKEQNAIKLILSEDTIQKSKEKLKDFKRPLIVFNAGGMFSKRQGRTYPKDKWIELGNKLHGKYNGTIVLTGEKGDKGFLAPLNAINNSVNYIGELSLEDSCGIISQCDLMISGDSGPLHIACALNVNSIGLYGSMPVNRTGCYSSGINIKSNKNCVPCNRRKCKYLKGTTEIYAPCMKEIETDEIIKAAKRFLG